MNPYLAEFVGTCILLTFGNGVVANVVLRGTKGNGAGWIVIAAGWGFAVFVAVFCVAPFSGAHINPAVTLAMWISDPDFGAAMALGYVAAQLAGGVAGATLVWLYYLPHYAITADADLKLATFCTAPAIRSTPSNLFCEALGTFALVFPIFLITGPTFEYPGVLASPIGPEAGGAGPPSVAIGLGALGALPVGLLVFAIGLSLGGTTGYAINPARDLGPRIAHAILPVAGKRDADWRYAWIPVVGPAIGAAAAAGVAMGIG